MEAWTVVAAAGVTGATAIIVGLIGVYSARLSAEVQKRQIQAETDRLLETHREAHFRHRQGIYHDLLNAERRAGDYLSKAEHGAKAQAMRDLLNSMFDPLNGAKLFGTADVALCANRLHGVLAVLLEVIKEVDSVHPGLDVKNSFGAVFDEWRVARRELIDAMRADVSADKLKVPEEPA